MNRRGFLRGLMGLPLLRLLPKLDIPESEVIAPDALVEELSGVADGAEDAAEGLSKLSLCLSGETGKILGASFSREDYGRLVRRPFYHGQMGIEPEELAETTSIFDGLPYRTFICKRDV